MAAVLSPTGTTVADVGPLFAAHEVGSTCDKQPETVFEQFTVLPPPNHFGDKRLWLQLGNPTYLHATLNGRPVRNMPGGPAIVVASSSGVRTVSTA